MASIQPQTGTAAAKQPTPAPQAPSKASQAIDPAIAAAIAAHVNASTPAAGPATAPPVDPNLPALPDYTTLPAFNPALSAADQWSIDSQVAHSIDPQITGLRQGQADYDAQQAGMRTDLGNFTTATQGLMAPLGQHTADAYNAAAANTAAFGKGFSDGLQGIMNGSQSVADAALARGGQGQAAGLVDKAVNPGAGATDAFYAVHGYNPAVALSAIGAAKTAQQNAQLGVLTARGQNLMFAAIKAAELGDKQWQEKLAAVYASEPALRDTITNNIRTYNLQLRQQQEAENNSANSLKSQTYAEKMAQYTATNLTPAEKATLAANAKQQTFTNNLAVYNANTRRAATNALITKGQGQLTIAQQNANTARIRANNAQKAAAQTQAWRQANMTVAERAAVGYAPDGITPLKGYTNQTNPKTGVTAPMKIGYKWAPDGVNVVSNRPASAAAATSPAKIAGKVAGTTTNMIKFAKSTYKPLTPSPGSAVPGAGGSQVPSQAPAQGGSAGSAVKTEIHSAFYDLWQHYAPEYRAYKVPDPVILGYVRQALRAAGYSQANIQKFTKVLP